MGVPGRTGWLALVFSSLVAIGAQGADPEAAEAMPSSLAAAMDSGQARFIDACAMCHGVFGHGDGQMSDMLAKAPADLTRLKKDNGGSFPWQSVYATVDGRSVPAAHGQRGMPVWADLWLKGVPEQYAESYVRGRILEVMLYLNSIQQD